MALKLSTAAADAMLISLATALAAGRIRIYSGTEPATADTALGAQVLLADLAFGNPAFNTGSIVTTGNDRVMSANAITPDSGANADGTAAFFRCTNTAGTTTYYQGTVGTTGQQLNLTNLNIVTDGVVSISSLSIAMPMQ